jgi:hypothetical protein
LSGIRTLSLCSEATQRLTGAKEALSFCTISEHFSAVADFSLITANLL